MTMRMLTTEERERAIMLIPPRAGTGLRHVVIAGEDRTLCGLDAELWMLADRTRAFDAWTIGCRRCRDAWNRGLPPGPSSRSG